MSFQSTWTPEQEIELRRLWGRHSIATISSKIGRAPATIWHRVRKLGLAPHPGRRWHRWTAAEDIRLVEMWRAGVSLRVIKDRLGRTYGQTDNRRRRLGLPNRKAARRPFAAAEDALILARWHELGPLTLSRMLDRTPAAVSARALRKLGLPRRDEIPGARKGGPQRGQKQFIAPPPKSRLMGTRA